MMKCLENIVLSVRVIIMLLAFQTSGFAVFQCDKSTLQKKSIRMSDYHYAVLRLATPVIRPLKPKHIKRMMYPFSCYEKGI